MQTRRKFLRDCSLVTGAVALVPATVLAQQPVSPIPVSALPGFAQFFEHVNTPFDLQAGAHTIRLRLVAAHVLATASPAAPDAGNEKFSLHFQGPAGRPLTQDTYELAHPRLGRLALFIVPVGLPDSAQRHYEAVFNRPANARELARQMAQAPRPSALC